MLSEAWCRSGLTQQAGDVTLSKRAPSDTHEVSGRLVRRQHLQGTYAITSKTREKLEGCRAAGLIAAGDAAADRLAVGEQIVEIVRDEAATIELPNTSDRL
jgi:hypothetical protein